MTLAGEVIQKFLEEPGGHLIMDTDLRIVDAGPEFLRVTKNRREDIIGKQYINIITDTDPARHQSAIEEIRMAAATATKSMQTYKMPERRLDIYDPDTNRAEERWWRSALTPVGEKEARYLVLRVEDITTAERAYRMILAQRRSNYVLYGCALLVAAILSWFSINANNNTDNVAKETCQTQKQGLQGTKLLVPVMNDIFGVIRYSPHPKTPVPKKDVFYALKLERDIGKYTRIENKLPQHHPCS